MWLDGINKISLDYIVTYTLVAIHKISLNIYIYIYINSTHNKTIASISKTEGVIVEKEVSVEN